jgi:hypothetical protein
MVHVKFVLIAILLFSMGAVFTTETGAQSTTYPQPTGLAIISGDSGDWADQLHTLDLMDATFVRLPITQGFGNHPSMIDDLKAIGITHIALSWQGTDCTLRFYDLLVDYQGRQYEAAVNEHRDIQFYLEVGNEPDLFCPNFTPATYRDAILSIREELRNLWTYPNLQYVAGLGAHAEYSRQILSDGRVLANYDGLAYHLYAHANLGDIPETYNYWRDELAHIGKPILLTEVGINGDIGEQLKAQRYRAFALQQPASTEAIAFWTVASDYKPQYHITPHMAQVMAGKECFAETGKCIGGEFANFWHKNGLDLGDPGISYRESLLLWGFPLTDEFMADTGYITQVFERMVFEYHPYNPHPYKVLLRRMGAERCEELCPR